MSDQKIYGGVKNSLSPSSNSSAWYQSGNEKHEHETLIPYIEWLKQNQKYRSEDNLRFLRMYGNNSSIDGIWGNREKSGLLNNKAPRLTLNVIKSAIDTVANKIGKNKVKPMFLTDGGNWSQQRQAKKLNKFCEGQLYLSDFDSEAFRCLIDAALFGTGFLKIFRVKDKIRLERTLPDEIVVDDFDGMYGKPRQMHQCKLYDRGVLAGLFPDKEPEIMGAPKADLPYTPSLKDRDLIMVYESWHLKSSDESDDGRHVIAIDGCTLHSEEWDKDYFPFAILRWTERPLGFYGQGVAEMLRSIQVGINKLLQTIQTSLYMVSIPKILIDERAGVPKEHIDNRIAGFIKWNGVGTPPTPMNLGAVPPELFTQLDRLYQRAFEEVGVSQLSAQSKKPEGLDSGKAIREFNDIESERFIKFGQQWEQFCLTTCEQMIELAREIDEDPDMPAYSVKYKDKKGFWQSVKWSEVQLTRDAYIMQAYPTSALSATPAGRLNDVKDLLALGVIGPEDVGPLLDFPDLESAVSRKNAGYEDITATIESLLDGKYEVPEPFQNLQLAKVMVQQAYLENRKSGAPEDILELLRRYIEDIVLLEEQQAAMVAQNQQAIQQIASPQPAQPVPSQNEIETAPSTGALQ